MSFGTAVSTRTPGWNPLRQTTVAPAPKECTTMTFIHGSHPHPLSALTVEVGKVCSVCRAVVSPSKAPCYMSTKDPSFYLCQKCNEVSETPLPQPHLLIRSNNVLITDAAASIRTRPKTSAHVLSSVPCGVLIPVVASTVDPESGKQFYRQKHGGWVPKDACQTVLPAPDSPLEALFTASLQHGRGDTVAALALDDFMHAANNVLELLRGDNRMFALSAAMHLHSSFKSVLEGLGSERQTPMGDNEEGSCSMMAYQSHNSTIFATLSVLSLEALGAAAQLLAKIPQHLCASCSSYTLFLLTVMAQSTEQLRELIQGTSHSPPRCTLPTTHQSMLGDVLSVALSAASCIPALAYPTVSQENVGATIRKNLQGSTLSFTPLWDTPQVAGMEVLKAGAWEECCVRGMHVSFILLQLAERASGNLLTSLSFMGKVRRLVLCGAPGADQISIQAMNVALHALTQTPFVESYRSFQSEVFNSDYIDLALLQIRKKFTDHSTVVAVSLITQVLLDNPSLVTLLGPHVLPVILPLLQTTNISLHHGLCLLELTAALAANPVTMGGGVSGVKGDAEVDEAVAIAGILPSNVTEATEVISPESVFLAHPQCTSQVHTTGPTSQCVYYASSELVVGCAARMVCPHCARRILQEAHTYARVYSTSASATFDCEGHLFLHPDVAPKVPQPSVAPHLAPTNLQTQLNQCPGVAAFLVGQLRTHRLNIVNSAGSVITALSTAASDDIVGELLCTLHSVSSLDELVREYHCAALAAAAFRKSSVAKRFASKFPNAAIVQFVFCEVSLPLLSMEAHESIALSETSHTTGSKSGTFNQSVSTPSLQPHQGSPYGLTPSPH